MAVDDRATGVAAPVRVLHVVYHLLGSGGIERWLMATLATLARAGFVQDVAVHGGLAPGRAEEIAAHGGRLLRLGRPIHPVRYARRFREILTAHGPYDIVHSHVPFPGVVMRLARRSGVPIRIAHAHLDGRGARDTSAARQAVVSWTNRWVVRDATAGFGVSGPALRATFGRGWTGDGRWRLLHCGVDLAPFEATPPRETVAAELGLDGAAGRFVFAHVGRLSAEKNHALLLDVAAHLARSMPDSLMLLIGAGPLDGAIRAAVRARGLERHVVLLGERQDVPRILGALADAFLFPSRYESLGLALVEAQAAGLPCLASDHVPADAVTQPDRVVLESLGRPVEVWAARAARLRTMPKLPRAVALAAVRRAGFDLRDSIASLHAAYREQLEARAT